jgi:tape measure domain-containing protein
MADYSYGGLSIVVQAITAPMAAEIRQAALRAGDEAAASLEKKLSRSITEGLVRGVAEGSAKAWRGAGRAASEGLASMTEAARKAATAAAVAASTAFEREVTARLGRVAAKTQEILTPMVEGARRAAATAAIAVSVTFDREVTARLGKVAAKAQEILTPMVEGARKAAATAAIAASVTFDREITARLNVIAAKAGDALSAMSATARTAAANAAVAASLAFDSILAPRIAKAAAKAGEALSGLSAAARKEAAYAASVAGKVFGEILAPGFAKAAAAAEKALTPMAAGVRKAAAVAARAAGSVFGDVLVPAVAKAVAAASDSMATLTDAAGAVAASASAAFGRIIVPGFAKAGELASTAFNAAMDSRVVAGARMSAAKAGESFKSVGKAAGGMLKGAAEAAALLGTGFIGYAVKAGVAYNVLYQKSIKAFTVTLGSQKAAEKMMANISAFAKTSPFPRQAFISATQTMLGYGVSAKKIIPTMSAVQDAVAAVGGGTDTFTKVINAIAKVQAEGKFTARTFNQLGSYGINAAQLIGQGMNLTAAQVRQEVTKNKLDTQTALTDLVTQMQIRYKGAAAGLKSTWTGAKQSIQAAMRDIGSAIVEPFISKKGGGLAIQWANKLGKVLWDLEPAVTPLVNALMVSLAPAIHAVNLGINWLLDQADQLKGKNLSAATKAVEKFGGAFTAVGAALSVFTGAKLLRGLPLIGDIAGGLLGPFEALAGPLGLIVGAITLMVAKSPKLRAALVDVGKGVIAFVEPVFSAVVTLAQAAFSWVSQLAGVIGDKLAPALSSLASWLPGAGKSAGKFIGSITGTAKAAVAKPAKQTAAQSVGQRFAAHATSATAVTPQTPGLLARITGSVTNFGRAVATDLTPIMEALAGVFKIIVPYWEWFFELLANRFGPILTRVWTLLWPLIQGVAKFIGDDLRVLGTVLGVVLPIAFKAFVAVMKWVVPIIIDGIAGIITIAIDMLAPFVKFLTWLLVHFWPGVQRVAGLLVGAWNWISSSAKKAFDATWGWIKDFSSKFIDWASHLFETIGKFFSDGWSGLVSGATNVGGDVLRVLKSGFEAAWKDISSWVRDHIVGPIVNAVKWFFHIGGSNPAGASAKSASSPVHVGAQGGGGTGIAVASAAAAAPGDDSGGGLWGNVGGIFAGMVEQVVTSDALKIGEKIFGSAADALGWIVVKGLVAVKDLGKVALGALEKIPGVSSALGFLGGALGGGVGGVTGLVNRALAYAGHAYIWGGGANSATGFDCSSFVNMIAGMAGLPEPGGFRAPSSQHGPVTGNWLSFGGLQTVPYDQMMPGDLYVNTSHMGIVTGKGMGFAARSTQSRTGPQSVPRGVYTIRRWPGGGGTGGGVGDGSLLAQALSGLLSQGQGAAPSVVSGSSSQNLETIARYMFGHGWSLPGAAGVAGNIWRESLGDPLSYGSGGRGLIGWTPPNTLPNSAFIPGNPSASLSRQLPLVNSFFRDHMGRYLALANAQSDAGLAALVIMNMGERPAGSSQSNPFFGGTGTSAGSQRAAMARNIFDLLRQSATVKMATGGVIREPVAGIGVSGTSYLLGENGPEGVLPAKLLEYLKQLLKMMAATAARQPADRRNLLVGSQDVAAPVKKAVAAAVSGAASKAAAAGAATAAAAGTVTGGSVAAVKKAQEYATRAAKVAATNAARAARVAASNSAALARVAASNTARSARVAATDAARLVKLQATITARMTKVSATNAARLASANLTNSTNAHKTAITNAADLARAQARHYASAQTRANAIARVTASNNERLAKLDLSNVKRLAQAKTTNATRLAAAEATSDAQLARAKATNASDLAKANASNAAALSKAETSAMLALEKTGISAAEALKKLAASNPGLIALAKGKPMPRGRNDLFIPGRPVLTKAQIDRAIKNPPLLPPWVKQRIGDVTGSASGRGQMAISPKEAQQIRDAVAKQPVVVNVFPREKQSETEVAAAVSRSLNWAAQGGARG